MPLSLVFNHHVAKMAEHTLVEFHGSSGKQREDFSRYLIQSLPCPVSPHCSVLPLPCVVS